MSDHPSEPSGTSALWRTAPGTTVPSGASEDWQAWVADTIEDVVVGVHDRVIRPLMLVVRGIVFGVVIAVMALALSVLGAIALIRVLDVYAFPGRVWASYAVLGGALVLIGAVAWAFRTPRGVSGD